MISDGWSNLTEPPDHCTKEKDFGFSLRSAINIHSILLKYKINLYFEMHKLSNICFIFQVVFVGDNIPGNHYDFKFRFFSFNSPNLLPDSKIAKEVLKVSTRLRENFALSIYSYCIYFIEKLCCWSILESGKLKLKFIYCLNFHCFKSNLNSGIFSIKIYLNIDDILALNH